MLFVIIPVCLYPFTNDLLFPILFLFKNLRTEVNTGANGTQDYIIKKGTNIGKVAKK